MSLEWEKVNEFLLKHLDFEINDHSELFSLFLCKSRLFKLTNNFLYYPKASL